MLIFFLIPLIQMLSIINYYILIYVHLYMYIVLSM